MIILGNIEISSGKKYWEFKLDRIPAREDFLLIGVCIEGWVMEKKEGIKDRMEHWGCRHLWGYSPVTAKKVAINCDN